jgi:hypothetical protein
VGVGPNKAIDNGGNLMGFIYHKKAHEVTEKVLNQRILTVTLSNFVIKPIIGVTFWCSYSKVRQRKTLTLREEQYTPQDL